MQQLTIALQWVSAIAYTLLGLAAVVDWLRRRERSHGYLALALGLLGLIILLGQVKRVMGASYPAALGYLTSVGLIGSGYGLLLFRHHLIPYSRRVLVAVSVGALGVSLWALTFPQQSNPNAKVSGYLLLFVAVYLGYWCGMVGEPAYRLWRASRGRPAVQRARLRALSFGYFLIVAVFVLLIGVIGAIAGSGGSSANGQINPVVGLLFQVLFIAASPVLYVSFRPPAWLRRSWRAREEEGYRTATQDLLLYSPGQAAMAERAVQWAARLIGADGAAIIEEDGSVLASDGLAPELIGIIAGVPFDDRPILRVDSPGNLTAVVVPMPLQRGTGRLAVVSGSFSPIFGGEETDRLREYATSVTAALDRVVLIERVKQANDALESRVAERTRQLEVSNVELSAANQELEAFSYSVSHDLRAPLRAIGGFARIMLEEHAAKLEPEALDYLRDIDTNAVEMGQLIDDLLQLSRLGRQSLSLQAVDPADVARGALDRLQPQIEGRSVEVDVADLPGCNADPALLQQVYLNLLSNAIKFTRASTAAQIEVGSIGGEAPTVYFVRDNGAGFDMAYKDKLFAVFQRLHRQEEYEGTGVGLALVQRIVARHDGRVWAEGEPGVGATFYFTLEGGAAA